MIKFLWDNSNIAQLMNKVHLFEICLGYRLSYITIEKNEVISSKQNEQRLASCEYYQGG